MQATNYFENNILNVFRGISFTAPATLYIGLYLNDPSETGIAGVEVSYQGYARQIIEFSSPSENIKYGAGNIGIEISKEITFPESNTNAGIATYIGISDSPSGGNMLAKAKLDPEMAILEGYSPKFLVGEGFITLTGHFSKTFKTKILNTFRRQSLGGITPYWGLFTANPEKGGNEFNAPNYERKQIIFATPTENATGANQISNINEITTNIATTNWGIHGCDCIMNAQRNGEVYVIIEKESENFLKSTQTTIKTGNLVMTLN